MISNVMFIRDIHFFQLNLNYSIIDCASCTAGVVIKTSDVIKDFLLKAKVKTMAFKDMTWEQGQG